MRNLYFILFVGVIFSFSIDSSHIAEWSDLRERVMMLEDEMVKVIPGSPVVHFDSLDFVTWIGNERNIAQPISGYGFSVDTDGDVDLGGIQAAENNRIFLIFNRGEDKIKIKHNGSSGQSNRFFCPEGKDFEIQSYQTVFIRYDEGLAKYTIL